MRKRRGMTQRDLAAAARLSDTTVRTAENDPRAVHQATVRAILESLVRVSPMTHLEMATLAQSLDWSVETVRTLNDEVSAEGPDRRPTGDGRAKFAALAEFFEDDTSAMAHLLDAVQRFCCEYSDRVLRDVFGDENLGRIIHGYTRRHFIELHPAFIEKKDHHQPYYHAVLPDELDGDTDTAWVEYRDSKGRLMVPKEPARPPRDAADERLLGEIDADLATITQAGPDRPPVRRVVLPPERRSDGALVERFEYYTPDGRRMVPAPPAPPASPPRAKPLRDGTAD